MPTLSEYIRRAAATALPLALALLLSSTAALADTAIDTPKPRAKPLPAATDQVSGNDAGMPIVSRADWQAKQPLFAMNPHSPRSILVHHTAGPVNAKRGIHYKMRSLQAYSQKSASLGSGRKRAAWADVPYHFYISAKGAVAEGRDIGFRGDTNTNYDPSGHIQVVLEGNFENIEPAAEQLASLETLLVALARKWQVPADQIRTHKNVAATLCPGSNLLKLFPGLRKRVTARLQ